MAAVIIRVAGGILLGHTDAVVSENALDHSHRHALHGKPRRAGMAETVKTNFHRFLQERYSCVEQQMVLASMSNWIGGAYFRLFRGLCGLRMER